MKLHAIWMAVMAMVICSAATAHSPDSDVERQVVEILAIETLHSPSLHLALVNRRMRPLAAEIATMKKELERAERAAEKADAQNRRVRQSAVRRLETRIRKANVRLDRLRDDAFDESIESMWRVCVWDGVHRETRVAWVFDDDRPLRALEPGDLVSAVFEKTALAIRGSGTRDGFPSTRPNLPLRFVGLGETVHGHVIRDIRPARDIPSRFQRCTLTPDAYPNATVIADDPNAITATVEVDDDPDETMLCITFTAPRDVLLASLYYEIHALDATGARTEPLTPRDIGHEVRLINDFRRPITTYLDPGTRHEHGFDVIIRAARYYEK